MTGLNCEAPINQPLHALFVARSGVDLPLKLYKAKAAAGQRFKVRRLQVNAKAAAASAAASRQAAAPAQSAAGDCHLRVLIYSPLHCKSDRGNNHHSSGMRGSEGSIFWHLFDPGLDHIVTSNSPQTLYLLST